MAFIWHRPVRSALRQRQSANRTSSQRVRANGKVSGSGEPRPSSTYVSMQVGERWPNHGVPARCAWSISCSSTGGPTRCNAAYACIDYLDIHTDGLIHALTKISCYILVYAAGGHGGIGQPIVVRMRHFDHTSHTGPQHHRQTTAESRNHPRCVGARQEASTPASCSTCQPCSKKLFETRSHTGGPPCALLFVHGSMQGCTMISAALAR